MRLAVFTNILNPYRSVFFEKLFNAAISVGDSVKVYSMVDHKSDRPWRYSDFEKSYTTLLPGITVHLQFGGYIHFNVKIKRALRDFKPEIVVMAGSYVQPTNLLLLRYAKRYHYKTVFWSESHFDEARNYGRIKFRFREWVRKKVLCKMDAFWYPGKMAERFVDTYRSKDARKIIVPNTINNSFFTCKDAYLTKGERTQKTLFTPARLTDVKGLLPFLDILQWIPSSNYCWKIAGEGPLESKIRNESNRLGCNVVLLGQLSQDSIKAQYEECDVFLLPSLSDPNPLSSIEALWMGCPLFVSNHVGNYPETVEEGKNGYVFSFERPQEAIAKLQKMLSSDREWYQLASKNSQKLAADRFNIDIIADRVIKDTKELL